MTSGIKNVVRCHGAPLGLALFLAAGPQTAQVPDGRQDLSASESSFLAENAAAMTHMMRDMAIKPNGDVDKDFVAMMVPHHRGAIDMAVAVLRYGHNEKIRRIAQEIIVTQQQEIVAMRLAIGETPSAAPAPAATSVPAVTQRAIKKHRGVSMP
jgi:uncharacterized protein (DUF305 family)